MKSKNRFKKFIIPMLILDLVGIINLILEIYLKDISYSSYIVLIICNIIVFGLNLTNKRPN